MNRLGNYDYDVVSTFDTDDIGAYCDWLNEREDEYWQDLMNEDTQYLYETPEYERGVLA
jgi:hypothetical protein